MRSKVDVLRVAGDVLIEKLKLIESQKERIIDLEIALGASREYTTALTVQVRACARALSSVLLCCAQMAPMALSLLPTRQVCAPQGVLFGDVDCCFVATSHCYTGHPIIEDTNDDALCRCGLRIRP